MANELSVNLNLTALKGAKSVNKNLSKTLDWSVARDSVAVQNIPTTAAGTLLALNASLTTNGWGYFNNLDSTNYVEIGIQTGGTFFPLCRCNSGEPAMFRLAQGVAVYARANTAAVDLEFGVLNN